MKIILVLYLIILISCANNPTKNDESPIVGKWLCISITEPMDTSFQNIVFLESNYMYGFYKEIYYDINSLRHIDSGWFNGTYIFNPKDSVLTENGANYDYKNNLIEEFSFTVSNAYITGDKLYRDFGMVYNKVDMFNYFPRQQSN